MDRNELVALAKQKASEAGLNPALVCAVCEQESSWNEFSCRYEPQFMSKYISPIFLKGEITPTEAYSRAFSWGLGQIMGQVAREHGFKGVFLSELCDPFNNLTLMCRILSANLTKSSGDETKALLVYNGGSRPAYADEVLARKAKYMETI